MNIFRWPVSPIWRILRRVKATSDLLFLIMAQGHFSRLDFMSPWWGPRFLLLSIFLLGWSQLVFSLLVSSGVITSVLQVPLFLLIQKCLVISWGLM